MRKIIFRETRVQGTWLSGSKSRCSISSTEKVLLINGKKRSCKRLGAIFKSIGKVLKTVAKVIIAIGAIAKLALVITNLIVW